MTRYAFFDKELRAHICEQIRERRIERGLTQDELARETGLSLRTISRIEHGTSLPSPRLLEFLNIDYKIEGIKTATQRQAKPLGTPQLKRNHSGEYYQVMEMLHFIDANELALIAATIAHLQLKK